MSERFARAILERDRFADDRFGGPFGVEHAGYPWTGATDGTGLLLIEGLHTPVLPSPRVTAEWLAHHAPREWMRIDGSAIATFCPAPSIQDCPFCMGLAHVSYGCPECDGDGSVLELGPLRLLLVGDDVFDARLLRWWAGPMPAVGTVELGWEPNESVTSKSGPSGERALWIRSAPTPEFPEMLAALMPRCRARTTDEERAGAVRWI